MQQLRFVNSIGEEINFTDGINYGVTEWNGLSECELNIQSQQVPFKDGSVYLDSLLSDRELSFTVALNDNKDLYKRYEKKREVISKLNPKLNQGYLYYKNDFLEKRIQVIPQIPIFPTKNYDEGGTLKFSISFIANNPYWEDLDEVKVSVTKGENEVMVLGDASVSLELLVEGEEVTNLTIENITNNKKLIFPELEHNFKMDLNTGKKSLLKATKQIVEEDLTDLIDPATEMITQIIYYKDVMVILLFVENDLKDGWEIITIKDGVRYNSEIYERKDGPIYVETNETGIYVNDAGNIYFSENGLNWEYVIGMDGYKFIQYKEYFYIVRDNHIFKTKDFKDFEIVHNSILKYSTDYAVFNGILYCVDYEGSLSGNKKLKILKIYPDDTTQYSEVYVTIYTDAERKIIYNGEIYLYDSYFTTCEVVNLLTGECQKYENIPAGAEIGYFKTTFSGFGYGRFFQDSVSKTSNPLAGWEDTDNIVNCDTPDLVYANFMGAERTVVRKEKTVLTDNIIEMLSPNSDMDFKLEVGKNILKITTDSGIVGGLITFRNKYIGV